MAPINKYSQDLLKWKNLAWNRIKENRGIYSGMMGFIFKFYYRNSAEDENSNSGAEEDSGNNSSFT